MMRSKFRRPWQPRMNDSQIFNPFAHTTEPEAGLADHQNMEIDEPEAHGTAAPRGDEAAPMPQSAGPGVDRV